MTSVDHPVTMPVAGRCLSFAQDSEKILEFNLHAIRTRRFISRYLYIKNIFVNYKFTYIIKGAM